MSASPPGDPADGGGRDSAPGPAGWFGKLRALGDFATRRLPPEFVEPWDEWLSEELVAAWEALGEDWADAYASAPTWRFALGAGVLGSGPWFGVLMPSFDRVGREYPLTFAARFPESAAPGDVETLACRWDRLIAIAAQVNGEPAWDVETLEAALHASQYADAAESAATQAPAALATLGRTATLWWPRRADTGADGPVAVIDGLPRGRPFVQLIRPGG